MNASSTPANRRRSARFSTPLSRERDIASPSPGPLLSTPSQSTRQVQHVAQRLPEGTIIGGREDILDRLLSDIANSESRHHARYSQIVNGRIPELTELLRRCVRPEVSAISTKHDDSSLSARSGPAIEKLKGLGGDLNSYGRAIYLHILYFTNNVTRLYVGQAFNLKARIKNQHMDWRYRRDHPSLHNFAMDRSIADEYVVLCTVREACERDDLVLNLLEMWMALWIGTLPAQIMEAWLGTPDGVEKLDTNEVYGLNVAEPLDQGDSEAWKSSFNALRESQDDMARDYFWDVRKRPRPVIVVKDAIASDIIGRGAWTPWLPLGLGLLGLGFAIGRWSVRFGRRR